MSGNLETTAEKWFEACRSEMTRKDMEALATTIDEDGYPQIADLVRKTFNGLDVTKEQLLDIISATENPVFARMVLRKEQLTTIVETMQKDLDLIPSLRDCVIFTRHIDVENLFKEARDWKNYIFSEGLMTKIYDAFMTIPPHIEMMRRAFLAQKHLGRDGDFIENLVSFRHKFDDMQERRAALTELRNDINVASQKTMRAHRELASLPEPHAAIRRALRDFLNQQALLPAQNPSPTL